MSGPTKSISYFEMIMGIRLFFGIYSDISHSKYICGLSKAYCFLYFILGICMYIDYVQKCVDNGFSTEIISVSITVYEYIVTASWNLYYKNEKLLKFYSVVKSVDSVLRWVTKERNVKVTFVMCVTIILSKPITQILVIGRVGFIRLINLGGFFMSISHFVAILPMVMILELFYTRLKRTRLYLSNCDKQMTEQQKMLIVNKFLYVYKGLMSIVDRMSTEMSFIVSFVCCNYVFKCIFYVYNNIMLLLQSKGNILMTTLALDQILENVVLGGTVWFAELALQEFALIKDESYREALFRTLQFLEVRPPKFTALRVIPIDARLILALISVCANYVIILLQFDI